jgi:hypothetical protein
MLLVMFVYVLVAVLESVLFQLGMLVPGMVRYLLRSHVAFAGKYAALNAALKSVW